MALMVYLRGHFSHSNVMVLDSLKSSRPFLGLRE